MAYDAEELFGYVKLLAVKEVILFLEKLLLTE